MVYPAIDKYNEAVQKPQTAFVDPTLQRGQVALNAFDLPIALGGGFALIYTVTSGGKKFAVRCFHKEARELQDRYAKISATLASISNSNFVGFQYQQSGIRVDGALFPVVKMDWADGETLGVWLEHNYKNKAAVIQLLGSFRSLEKFLRDNRIAHGDLQNGNVLVDGSTIKLIDYDGLFVPSLQTSQGNELGHKHFQHPKRQGSDFGPIMDRFSFITIDLSLRTLAEEPALFDKFSNGENILFSVGDYLDPASSAVFADILAIPSLAKDTDAFAKICRAPIANVPSLEDFLACWNINTPTVLPVPGQRPAAARSAVYVGAYAVIDASDYMAAQSHVGDCVELVGRIIEIRKGKTKYGDPYVFINFGFWNGLIVKLTIWSESLKKLALKPDQSWVGRWISVVGLLEPPYIGKKHNYSHISITIKEVNQYRFINATEAQRRLASIGKRINTAATGGGNQAILATLKGRDESLTGNGKQKSGWVAPSSYPPAQPMSSNRQLLEQICRQANTGTSASTSGPSCPSRTHSGQRTPPSPPVQAPTLPTPKEGVPTWVIWLVLFGLALCWLGLLLALYHAES